MEKEEEWKTEENARIITKFQELVSNKKDMKKAVDELKRRKENINKSLDTIKKFNKSSTQ